MRRACGFPFARTATALYASFLVLRFAVVSLALGLAATGCSPSCTDIDGDHYGPGCAMGPDCDPTNAARNVDCVGVPAPDCEADPTATGCPCLVGASTPCTSHPDA